MANSWQIKDKNASLQLFLAITTATRLAHGHFPQGNRREVFYARIVIPLCHVTCSSTTARMLLK
jgi:hypothetical protein